jgi:tripartite-type tricarboxylate transporter receptor subunit TctC
MVKTNIRRRLLHFAAGAAALAVLSVGMSSQAASQTARTIKIIVPFATGGAASVLAHLLADHIAQMRKLPTVVENRPGAGTALATEAVASAAADGNTLLLTNNAFLINPLLRKQNYDPLTGFQPICNLVSVPSFIVVNGNSPYYSLAHLLNAARTRPGELTLATFTATGSHLSFERLKQLAKVDITFVPYPGSGPAVTALLGEHVTALMDNYATVVEHVRTGRLRTLATLSGARIDALPTIPTIAEAAQFDLALDGWFGLLAPANVPKEAVAQLVSWTTAAMQTSEVKQRLEPLGLFPRKMCGEDFAALLRRQYGEFGQIIREANIKAE